MGVRSGSGHSRANADRSWQISLVNELLTWMQDHPYPLICATNFEARLDAASLRRFTFQIELREITKTQALMAFRTFFPTFSHTDIDLPSGLVPSDFVNAVKALRFHASADQRDCVNAIEAAGNRRRGSRAKPIGFIQFPE